MLKLVSANRLTIHNAVRNTIQTQAQRKRDSRVIILAHCQQQQQQKVIFWAGFWAFHPQ